MTPDRARCVAWRESALTALEVLVCGGQKRSARLPLCLPSGLAEWLRVGRESEGGSGLGLVRLELLRKAVSGLRRATRLLGPRSLSAELQTLHPTESTSRFGLFSVRARISDQ